MTTLLSNDSDMGDDLRMTLPVAFSGRLDEWEDWSWSLKTYVFLFHPELDDWLDYVEQLEVEITDDHLKTTRPPTGSESLSDELTGERLDDWKKKTAISKRLHYRLANVTVGAAKTEVKNNLKGNCFETWRRPRTRLSLPGTDGHIGLLSMILKYDFSSQNFEEDFAAWENLKTKYEQQTGTTLPDSVLMSTLLNKTSGKLQTHIRLNSATLKLTISFVH